MSSVAFYHDLWVVERIWLSTQGTDKRKPREMWCVSASFRTLNDFLRSLFSHELSSVKRIWLSTQETKEKPRQRRQRETKIKKFGVSQQVSKPFPITFDASNVLQSLFSHEFQTEGLVWLSTQETQERSKYGKLSCLIESPSPILFTMIAQ